MAAAFALASCATLEPSPPEAKLERLVEAYFDEWLARERKIARWIDSQR